MNCKIFIVALSILTVGISADIEIGSCKITNPSGTDGITLEDDSITISKKDNDTVNAILAVSEDFGLYLLDPSESASLYINITKDGTNLKINSNDAWDKFDLLQEVHSKTNSISLRGSFSMSCGGETKSIELIVEIIDANNHDPTFTSQVYDYKLPKTLLPNYDLSTVMEENLIIVEDVDFSNMKIDLTVEPSDIFDIKSVAEDTTNKRFIGFLTVKKAYNISAPLNLTLTATDTGEEPLRTATAYIIISAPNIIGVCSIDDYGYLDYGFFEKTIADNATDFTLSFAFEGNLNVDTPNTEDSGAAYIDVSKDDEKKIIEFKLKGLETFEENHKALISQPTITVLRSVVLTCGEEDLRFTFGLVLEDVNDHAPTLASNTTTYSFLKPLMPRVDLTSADKPIIFEDIDFSNTDITFTVDAPFSIETVPIESIENKRQYKAVLRVSEYIYDFDGKDSVDIQITATDSGSPPLSSDFSFKIELKS